MSIKSLNEVISLFSSACTGKSNGKSFREPGISKNYGITIEINWIDGPRWLVCTASYSVLIMPAWHITFWCRQSCCRIVIVIPENIHDIIFLLPFDKPLKKSLSEFFISSIENFD